MHKTISDDKNKLQKQGIPIRSIRYKPLVQFEWVRQS